MTLWRRFMFLCFAIKGCLGQCGDFSREITALYGYTVEDCRVINSVPVLTLAKHLEQFWTCEAVISSAAAKNIRVEDCVAGSADRLFYRLDGPFTWDTARKLCHVIPGGDLAAVNDLQDFIALHHLSVWLPSESAHIGLVRVEKAWKWSFDGSVLRYARWNTDASACETFCGGVRHLVQNAENNYQFSSFGYFCHNCSTKAPALCQVSVNKKCTPSYH